MSPEATGSKQAVRYVLRDLPGVPELEALVAGLGDHPSPLWDPNHSKAVALCDAVARDLFGLTDDTIGEDFLESVEGNEDAVEDLARFFGWDINDEAGDVLACFHWLAAPLIYATRGLGGFLPDPDRTAEVATWELRMRREAEAFRRKARR